MKILYSHRTRSADGQYVHIRELTDALIAGGHDIIMAGPSGKKEDRAKTLDAGGGQWRAVMPNALYEFAELAYSVPSYWRLRALYAKSQPDILYQRYNLFYYPGAWLKWAKRIPLILEVNAPLAEERAAHGGLAMKGFARNCEREVWRAADMVLPVTEVLADRVRAAGVAEDKITVIQNGVSDAFLNPPTDPSIRSRYGLEGKIILGFAGFVRAWHGADRVLRFLAQTQNPQLHFLLVGDGTARADLEQLAEDLGVAEQMTITGVVQRNDMPAYMSVFDIALQPAVTEYASPLKLFEYMALSKAIIAPDAPNIRETLSDSEEALLFSPTDENDFYAKLSLCIDQPDLRARLGAAARKNLIARDLTWAGNAKRIEKIAEKLIGGG